MLVKIKRFNPRRQKHKIDSLKKEQMTKHIESESTIICPECGFSKTETMPTDACQFFYQCTNCGQILKPLKGDCCVFCSYGNVKCPPIQESGECNCCGL
jgi:rubredoxin